MKPPMIVVAATWENDFESIVIRVFMSDITAEAFKFDIN